MAATLNPPRGIADSGRLAGVSDGQLLSRFTTHRDEWSETAFAALVHRHGPTVLRVCRQILGDSHTAEDAFQATFLILAKKAGAIRQPDLLGNWLYGVALRTAREARTRDDRRRRHESPRTDSVDYEPVGDAGGPDFSLARREEFEVLHEEVSRLPERYRVPVVLCELEGLTYQEAARRMSCPEGTIGVRLRRARQRLRIRLTRRGIAPSAALVGAVFGAGEASAWLSPALISSTIRGAVLIAAGEIAAPWLVSTSVVALTDRVLRKMVLNRLKMATGLVLTVAITATVGWVGARRDAWMPAISLQASLPSKEATPPAGPRSNDDGRMSRPAVGQNRDGGDGVVGDRRTATAKPVVDVATTVSERSNRNEWARGEALFAKEWVRNDPTSHGGDGLGPVFNETSCMACHGMGAPGGAGPESKNVVLLTATPVGRVPAKGLELIHPGFSGTRSTVLHRYGTDPEYRWWRRRFYETHRDGGSKAPTPSGEDSVESRIHEINQQSALERRMRDRSSRSRRDGDYTLVMTERNPPSLFGAGLIDAVPSEVLVAMAQSQTTSVRGLVGRTREGQVGRFGWKAQIPSLHEFVRAACANELGLEVPGHSQAPSPLDPGAKPTGLDMSGPECDAMVAYVRALPAPLVVDPSGPLGSRDMREGRSLFSEVGCAECHTPTLGKVRGIYSDLLLHDLGPSLSDSGSYYGFEPPDSPGIASSRHWRTPPLWGYRDSAPYLHDGRAQGLEEAVALHEGQAKDSAHRFFALPSLERSLVETFLKSLVAPSWASTPGVVLASEMESRIEQEEGLLPEAVVRARREAAVARDEAQWQDAHRRRDEDHRRRLAEEAAMHARSRLPSAQDLEKMGKVQAAIDFYRQIVRLAPESEEGRLAAERIATLGTPKRLP